MEGGREQEEGRKGRVRKGEESRSRGIISIKKTQIKTWRKK